MLTTVVFLIVLFGILLLGFSFNMFSGLFLYGHTWIWTIIIVGIILCFYFTPINLWVIALFSGAKVRLIDLILMRIRRVPPSLIVDSLITAIKAGLDIKCSDLETHYLAGGNVQNVIKALISADKANIKLSFNNAAAIDLAGRDVFEAVQISVNPKVIDTQEIAAVAKDGIQLLTRARVTVRANIQQLVGGAGEETILARVGEGIVTSIGLSENHKLVLANPNQISQLVLGRGLDKGTAFNILSIDIADVNVGDNIGAKLQTDQADADLKVANAKAEERRAMAVAIEQEMRAKAQEAKAQVILSEAEVPKALAAALKSGSLGVMDYYKLQNIKADTSMRNSLSSVDLGNNSETES